ADVEADPVSVVTRKWMQDNHIDIQEAEETLSLYEKSGKTAMIISVNGVYMGVIAVADTIKETAPEAIRLLKEQGLDVVMLTVDNELTANDIAELIGCDEVIEQVLTVA